MSEIYISLWHTPSGGQQLSIDRLDETGQGTGYRIFGPKFIGDGNLVRRTKIDRQMANEIRRYLDEVES